MQKAILVKGRLTGPRTIELDEPVADVAGEVEVILRPRASEHPQERAISAFLKTLPPGKRTREELDRQLQEERAGWERNA